MGWSTLHTPGAWFLWALIPITVWDVVLKGVSLWRSARNNQKGWFIALLIINSVGILPLIYLFFFQKKIKK